jgi:hypothetical protein
MQAFDAHLARDAPLAPDLAGLLVPGKPVNDVEQHKQDTAKSCVLISRLRIDLSTRHAGGPSEAGSRRRQGNL